MMSVKQKYRQLCECENSIPVFSRAWWLDAVAPGVWDVVIVENDGEIIAALPFVLGKNLWFKVIFRPPLTQNLGPWIRSTDTSYSKQLSRENELMDQLFSKLPYYDGLTQNWHYDRKNWLQLFWNGFSQTTRYTYVIDSITDTASTVSNFERSKQKDIKKALKKVSVKYDISAEEFYENHKMTLLKQGSRITYTFELFERIYNNSYARNAGRTIAAYDDQGNLHAALFIVFDDLSGYAIISTIDPDYRTYAASSLLFKEAILCSAERVDRFDFEGSMIEGVENSFRRFGAIQKPYHSVSHTPSFILELIRSTRALLRNRIRK
jgi:hypothetical protein